MSVGYNESRWQQHNGQPSTSGGYGIMHLTQFDEAEAYDAKGTGDDHNKGTLEETPEGNTLEKASELLDVDPEVLKTDASEKIRGELHYLHNKQRKRTVNYKMIQQISTAR